MNAIFVSIYFLFLFSFTRTSDLENLRQLFYNAISSSAIYDITTNPERSLSKRSVPSNYCDENQLMLALADLEVVSPERILLMFSSYGSSIQVCAVVTTAVRSIEKSQKDCKPLEDDNLYMILFKGLKTFEETLCKDEKYQNLFDASADCFEELREEYIECEGPGDWFEFPNSTMVCEKFDEIVICDYIKTAELCGLDTGAWLFNLITKVITASLKYPCSIPNKPQIKNFAAEFSATTQLYPSHTLLIIALIIFDASQ